MKIKTILLFFGMIFLIVALISPVGTTAQKPRKVTLLSSVGPRLEEPTRRMYYSSPSGDERRILALRRDLIAAGAEQVNTFLPGLIVCEVPVSVDPWGIVKDGDISVATEDQVDHRVPDAPVFSREWAKKWYLEYEKIAATTPADTKWEDLGAASAEEPKFHGTNVRMIPIEVMEREIRRARMLDAQGQDERLIFQNAEIMSGNVLVQLVIPESIGSAENWTDAEITDAAGAVAVSTVFYQREARRTDLNFITRRVEKVPTSTEPINYQDEMDSVWVSNVMANVPNMNYEDRPCKYLNTVHDYNNYYRERFQADWAFTAFVVRAVNDPDHNFPGSRSIGYAYLGGPFLAVPYPAGTAGAPESFWFSQAVTNLMARVFWAQDETFTGTVPPVYEPDSCNTSSGYLNFPNRNKTLKIDPITHTPKACGFIPEFCVANRGDMMDWGYTGPPCKYTEGMLGYIDTDPRDGVPDAFNAPPDIDFGTAAVETLTAQHVNIKFDVISVPVENRNSKQREENRRDYAAPIMDVNYTLGGVGPISMNPVDGEYDEIKEEFYAEFPFILPGYSDLVVTARNVYGARGQETKRVFYLGLDYYGFRFVHKCEGLGLAWSMRGETFDADFDLHRIDHANGDRDTVVASGLDPVGSTGAGGMTPFYYLDRTVLPGSEYTYYLRGSFQAMYRGKLTTFTTDSDGYTTVAAFPCTEGILSSPSPNPFCPAEHCRMWITVSVPGAPGGLPQQTKSDRLQRSAAAETPQPVAVSIKIYDVLGRVVKDLYSDRVYDSVVNKYWDGTDQKGEPVSTGMYFLKAQAGTQSDTKKVLVIR